MKYAGVVIETKSDNVDNVFTYAAGGLDLRVGSKVRVPFGMGGSEKTGFVFSLSDDIPDGMDASKLKSVSSVDPDICLSEDDIRVCEWMKKRYYCRLIDAAGCFVPAGKAPVRKKAAKVPEVDEGGDLPPLAAAHENSAPDPNAAGGSGEPGRPEAAEAPMDEPPAPTAEQKKAISAILPAIDKGQFAPFLLHGVTGSGKTEVYMAAAAHAIKNGKRVILLVPEITLTHQTVERFSRRFGPSRVAVLHSKLSGGERYREWMRVRQGEADIVIGARSAVFAPVGTPGLFIVDEEHETTYKSDTIPKYDAVEVAMKRARESGAAVVLGSATPSVVSSYRAERGRYRKILMTKRYNQTPLPDVRLIDMRKEALNGNTSLFSRELYAAMTASLENGKQILLFLNRRGWAPYISCTSCGYVMKCESCNISMTYHNEEKSAVCHYCGRHRPLPRACPACGEESLKLFGLGTEQLEEQARLAFPEKTVARLDVDAARKKGSAEKILKGFSAGKIDILAGTQMIAKGLDFENVGLVGAVSADISLNIPDFRSTERTYQLITQVSGRAGRREDRGLVYVQTYMPDNYAVASAATGDYEGYYRTELYFRSALSYPPFSDVIQVTAYGDEEEKTAAAAEYIRGELAVRAGEGEEQFILGPRPAPIAKVDGDFRYQVFVKAMNRKRKVYEGLLSELKQEINTGKRSGVRVTVEVNPFSLL
ncbi:MAG: primosomal protein N' [Clostridiales Family XIII bacterium]|nr:primosomal protein N' [Clostridiales Family XIII bacterium]